MSPDAFELGLGVHRVVSPRGVLPQAADVLDPRLPGTDTEAVVDVERLVLDATSMRQLASEHGADGVGAAVAAIVARRGKMHNPATGSGGIAYGSVRSVGDRYPARDGLHPGAPVATLTSLTVLPLALDAIEAVDVAASTVHVRGTAILPATGPVAVVPDDLPLDVVLAALDVAGAPAHVIALARQGDRVAVVGAAGNAGLLVLAAARVAVGPDGVVVAVEAVPERLEVVDRLAIADVTVLADATDAVATAAAVRNALGGAGADLVVHVANVAGCEGACYLSADPAGTVLFFSMATSFTAAALGAEGVGSTVRMLVGNGYSPDRGAVALGLLRDSRPLRDVFAQRHGKEAAR